MNRKYIETALTLARLYGIAETLHPWEYLENDKFPPMIESWTDEFFRTGKQDIVQFFEAKIKSR